jgi:hypothetical protein
VVSSCRGGQEVDAHREGQGGSHGGLGFVGGELLRRLAGMAGGLGRLGSSRASCWCKQSEEGGFGRVNLGRRQSSTMGLPWRSAALWHRRGPGGDGRSRGR